MKKNSGFMLFETLIVSTLVLGTLVFLYVQLTSIKKSYNASFRFDTIEGLYKAKMIATYLEKTGYQNIETAMGDGNNVDITNCVYVGSLCTKLFEEANVKQIYFVKQDITDFKELIKNDMFANKEFKRYLKYLKNTKEGYDYRLIVLYHDGTYASVGVKADLSRLNKYTLTNKIKNNGFESGVDNWTIVGPSNATTVTTNFKKSGSKSLSFITSDTEVNRVYQNVSITANHVYYVSEYIYIDKAQQGFINLYLNESTTLMNKDTSTLTSKKWNKVTSLFKPTVSGTYSYHIIAVNNANNIYIDNIMLIDLTSAFGQGNEPTLEWCNKNIKYFNNTNTIYK